MDTRRQKSGLHHSLATARAARAGLPVIRYTKRTAVLQVIIYRSNPTAKTPVLLLKSSLSRATSRHANGVDLFQIIKPYGRTHLGFGGLCPKLCTTSWQAPTKQASTKQAPTTLAVVPECRSSQIPSSSCCRTEDPSGESRPRMGLFARRKR